MTPVFADTFYFAALLNRHDARHEQATRFATEGTRPLVTTAWVLTELADGLASVSGRKQFAILLEYLESDPQAEIVRADDTLWVRGVELYDSRPDKEWSLTDCISFIVMQDRGLTDALTGDRHFEQAGFTALLK